MLLRGRKRGEENREQQGDDSDDDENFNQREAGMSAGVLMAIDGIKFAFVFVLCL